MIQKMINYANVFHVKYMDDNTYKELEDNLHSTWNYPADTYGAAVSTLQDLHGQFKDSVCDGGYLMVDAESNLLSCVSYGEFLNHIHINFLASIKKGCGYGTRLMYEMCKFASIGSKRLELTTTHSAMPFYEKIGMIQDSVDPYKYKLNWYDGSMIEFMRRVEDECEKRYGSLWMLNR